jgi:hypothetical protein
MKFKAQLVHIVNPEADTSFFKNESIDLVFSTISRSPELLCISLDRSRLMHSGFALGEIHLLKFLSNQDSIEVKTLQISIIRQDSFQRVFGTMITPNLPKLRTFLNKKNAH